MSIMQKQLQNTENFLTAYLMEKDLSKVSGCDEHPHTKTSPEIVLAPVKPYDKDLQCGQIRLLADVDRITYIVLLCNWGDNAFVTMAFSHYDFPATNEELSLERDVGLYLNVLQVWNTCALLNETLRKSWLCGKLPEEMCNDALTFWMSMTTGKALPDRLAERSGTPVTKEDDIRLEYLQEEKFVFAKFDSSDLAPVEMDVSVESPEAKTEDNPFLDWMKGLILPPLWQEEELALAAGGEKKPIQKKCSIEGREEILILEYSQNEGKVWIDILLPDESGWSTALDGSGILDEEENERAVIENGKCVFEQRKPFNGSIGLRLKDRTIHTLKEKKG